MIFGGGFYMAAKTDNQYGSIIISNNVIAKAAGFKGELKWDSTKPDGMYRKLMDSSKARSLGWKPQITLDEGIERTVKEFASGAGAGKLHHS